jgi:signal peptidase II
VKDVQVLYNLFILSGLASLKLRRSGSKDEFRGDMKFKYKALIIIAPLFFLLDQLTKWLVTIRIPLGSELQVIPGFFDVVHYTNSGAAFGMLSGLSETIRTPFFYGISVIALVGVIIYIIKLPDRDKLTAVALSLVVSGIFGNGIDRIRFGRVTDFLSFHISDKVLYGMRLEWPAFNIADSVITIAMVLLIISAFKKDDNPTAR